MFMQIIKGLFMLISYPNISGVKKLTKEEEMHLNAQELLFATRQFCASKIALNHRLLERNFDDVERLYVLGELSGDELKLGDFVDIFPDQDFFRTCILKQFMVEILLHSFESRCEKLKMYSPQEVNMAIESSEFIHINEDIKEIFNYLAPKISQAYSTKSYDDLEKGLRKYCISEKFIDSIKYSLVNPHQLIYKKAERYFNQYGDRHAIVREAIQSCKALGQEEKDNIDDFSSDIISAKHTENNMVKIFISHSSHDIELVSKIVDFLRTALNLTSRDIRCTSLDGYRLPGGANFNDQLRQEVYESQVFIGLISPASFQSQYVLFELGARWGANKQLIPLLSPNLDSSLIKEPLKSLNALKCNNSSLIQLVEELSELLDTKLDKQSAYQRYIDEIVKM
jgi:TIR domain